jgi:DNA-binding NtrC family response regulator
MATDGPVLLIVDDEVRILSALRRILRREGYAIHTADSGAEALRIFRAEPVDLVLSDHKMPGMNGIELFSEIESLRPKTPKILISGWTEEVPRADLRRLGVFAMLPKPWDDAELKSTLRDALGD